MLTDPAAVAVHGLRCNSLGNLGRLAVVGAGVVGLLTALYADSLGWQVTILGRNGVTLFRPDDPVPSVRSSPKTSAMQASFDVVVDAASGADSAPLELALWLVTDGGTIIVQNAYHPAVGLPIPLRDIFRRSIRLVGSFSYCRRGDDDFEVALRLLRSHAATVERYATRVAGIEGLQTAINDDAIRLIRRVLAIGDRR
ncbi:hypothetical protein ACFWF3_33345 [Nocardia sp. NPDC060220]|uniref:hypothetical protein n=1 Tax=Nocardia sp. NPDC060220 TaxID=3347076 RepID=UPI0036608FFF